MTKRHICAPPLLLLVAMWTAGCTLSLHSQGGNPPSTPAPAVRVAGTVDVRAGKSDQPGRTVSVDPYDVQIDYAEFAGDAVEQLRQAIAQQGGAAPGGTSKSLELAVMYVDILRTAGSFSCLIDYRITMGDGTVRGLQARDASWNYETACRRAVGDVAGATLRDPAVVRYLSDFGSATPTPFP